MAFLPLPAFGHITTNLPIAEELIRRGHRVTFATTDRYAALAERTGARVLRYDSWLASRTIPDRVDAEYLAHEPVRSIDEALATVPLYEAGFGDDLPDVLLYDVSTFAAGRVLSRKWGRPAIQMYGTFASNEHYSLTQRIGALYEGQIPPDHPALIDFFVKQGRLLEENGLTGMTLEEFNAPSEESNLVFLPKRLQPAHETFDDDRFAFVGACLDTGRAGEPPWDPPADGEPLVLVTKGSFSYDRQEDFVRLCADAFADTGWQVVMSVGEKADLGALGPLPKNLRAMSWVPQLSVLDRADVLVSHAGTNSVVESLAFGTPLVTLPQMPEQRLIAERLTELGLGVELPTHAVTADSLRSAVLGIAADEGTRARVGEVRAEIRAVHGPSFAADRIEARATS
uniref:Glycosyltransferase n=1 Tax=Streptomyces sp. WAC2288 TaxID=1582798 RepID=A0A1I9J5P6_9ACTN|nr:glycosyltransferase [Streptomyces sp. WAC2288]